MTDDLYVYAVDWGRAVVYEPEWLDPDIDDYEFIQNRYEDS